MKKLIRQLELKKKQLEKLRDQLSEIEAEAQALGNNCDDAVDSISRAMDALSELV